MLNRSTAVKIRINEIHDGEFIRSQEQYEPNYLVTPSNEKIGRVRILGSVVSKFENDDKNYSNITIDDGNDTITVRAFKDDGELLEDIDLGDIIDVMGKVKEYQEERYISPESIWKLDNPNWELVRKLELLTKKGSREALGKDDIVTGDEVKEVVETPPAAEDFAKPDESAIEVVEEIVESEPEEQKPEPSKNKKDAKTGVADGQKTSILKLIKDMDEGDGVKYVTLLKESKLAEEALEAVLNDLMQDGDVYEPKIGRFKGI